mgnify:CR=1 FL=1
MKCNVDIRPLKELADIQTGPFGSQLHKEDYVEVGTPIVTVEHLGNRIFTEQNLPKVSDGDRKRLEKYLLSTGDIVFSRVGSVDRCSYVDERHSGWMFSGRCLRIRPSECINPLYLYYYFCLEEVRQFVRNIAVGATMPSINTKLLGEVPVSVPSIQTQRRIAAILSSLDDKIELNNKINANLEQQAQAVFTAWFAEAKPSVSFVSLVRVLGGGTPRTSVAEFWEGEIPFFTPKDVYGVYTLETEKSLTDDGLAHCNSCLFPINTVFVTARGTVGKLTLAGRPMAMNQSCYALLGQEGYGQYFIYHLTQRVITHLKHKANGAVFDAIVTRDFESEFVPDIKPSEAANFELKVKPLYEAILHNYEENSRLSALRDMLLPRLISDDLLPLEFQ